MINAHSTPPHGKNEGSAPTGNQELSSCYPSNAERLTECSGLTLSNSQIVVTQKSGGLAQGKGYPHDLSLPELTLNDLINNMKQLKSPSFKRYPNGQVIVFNEYFEIKEVKIE